MIDPKVRNYDRRKYAIVAYDPDWKNQFEENAHKVKAIFGDVFIEHVGSTSVEGMMGKPCIDLLVLVDDLGIVDGHIREMESAGYLFAGELAVKGALLFRKMSEEEVFVNVHFFPKNHPHAKEMIQLRDFLRGNAKEVEDYSNLKKSLFKKYPNKYASYRKEKDAYMEEMKKRIWN